MKTQLVRYFVLASVFIVSFGFVVTVHGSGGTGLSIIATTDDVSPACSDRPITINVAVMSSGSAAPVSLLASTDGLTFANLGTITDWSIAGRTKMAEGTIQITVAKGITTVVEVRAIQPGANGDARQNASANVTITPHCGEDAAPPAPRASAN